MPRPETPWQIFIWTVSIFTLVIGALFWRIEAVASGLVAVQTDVGIVRSDIAVIKTDAAWIKQILAPRSVANALSAPSRSASNP